MGQLGPTANNSSRSIRYLALRFVGRQFSRPREFISQNGFAPPHISFASPFAISAVCRILVAKVASSPNKKIEVREINNGWNSDDCILPLASFSYSDPR